MNCSIGNSFIHEYHDQYLKSKSMLWPRSQLHYYEIKMFFFIPLPETGSETEMELKMGPYGTNWANLINRHNIYHTPNKQNSFLIAPVKCWLIVERFAHRIGTHLLRIQTPVSFMNVGALSGPAISLWGPMKRFITENRRVWEKDVCMPFFAPKVIKANNIKGVDAYLTAVDS